MKPTKVYSSTPFTRSLKRLVKKYPRARNDVFRLVEELQKGETPGDQIPM